MSELTPCNYCTFKSIKYRLDKEGREYYLKKEGGFTSLYSRPKKKIITHPLTKEKIDITETEPKFHASFLELTNYCCC